MSSPGFQFDDLLSIENIIRDACASSLTTYYAHSTANYKPDGSIVTEADLAMQETLTTLLAEKYPSIKMLGEEDTEECQQAVIEGGGDFWCLDPVDGTTNFHATMPLFSVSLALVSQGEVILGVIYDPNQKEFFSAIKGQGFWVNDIKTDRQQQPESMSQAIAFVDFKRLNNELRTELAVNSPYKSQRNIGTCALEWAWLAAGRASLLVHGREKLWDYAAGYLLNLESGGISESFAGEPVFNNSLEPRSVIAASNAQLFDQWSHKIRSFL
ncbi:MAG: myo-inositol-1(or 4)-monophosphatase [Planctomycetota bacterium]